MIETTLCSLSSRQINISIFLLLITVRSAVSRPPEITCGLGVHVGSAGTNSTCMEGNWGGFLEKNCCGSVFQSYLSTLGQRANRTGLIFLQASEQTSCLESIRIVEDDVFSCGIQKLTSGGGGCSDFSVADVTDKLGDELKSLNEHCDLAGSDAVWNDSCSSCVNSWRKIDATPVLSNSETPDIETDVCRFALLISLISTRIDDKPYVQRVYKCLKDQKNDSGSWILIIAIVVITLTIATKIVSRRCRRSGSTVKRNAFQDLRLKESPCRKFLFKEVYSATDNLNDRNLIGEGTAGKVYKGKLSNNQEVAIKHIVNDGHVETVIREIMNLYHVKHPNLVALLGCCIEEDECFLVYELCPNGNLSEWIFGRGRFLPWIQRLKIAIDSARGLWFLHTYSEGCIVHRDIKPTNILLGENFDAKLSDFGLSKVIDLDESNTSSEVRGTFGYVDPEYQSDHHVNSSGDVYSFGIVLLQILSGKKVINMNLRKPMPLDKMAKSLASGGSILEFADPKLEGEYSAEAFGITFSMALSCISLKHQRPSMELVVAKLEEAFEISKMAKASTPFLTPCRSPS
ncbi:hypothetical protein K2173_020338 [Erythroxylum novogranatense]|uniref:Protein kinase domain-containing protein n=1 Tax=Erythroxylum novogranatense TaxID=1862640 RepID=A0AAV8UB66_9ROSI|nr:hypothetical protein K2173_020338 [Erythroxylum novogranatense]